MSRTVYLNGQFVPEAEAKLSIYDLSVMQACAAFEMLRSFHGVTFKLREHLERLWTSCELLGLPWPAIGPQGHAGGLGTLMELCDEMVARNDHGPGEEHRVLIVVSPGCAPMYRELAGVIPHPFLYLADFPLRYTVQGFSRYFTEGVHGVTSKIQQVPDACVPSRAKHRSRLHFHLAQQQAPAGTWPVLRSAEGHYCEAPGANLVMVRNGQVHLLEAQALPGISLETVRALTGAPRQNGDPWVDWWRGPRCEDPIAAVDELWLTGTPFCLLPVVSLDGQPIGDGRIGPVYKETLGKWSELVGVDIQKQIEEWDAHSNGAPTRQNLSSLRA